MKATRDERWGKYEDVERAQVTMNDGRVDVVHRLHATRNVVTDLQP